MIAEKPQTFVTQERLAQFFSDKLETTLDAMIARQRISEEDALKVQTLVFDAFKNILDAPHEIPIKVSLADDLAL